MISIIPSLRNIRNSRAYSGAMIRIFSLLLLALPLCAKDVNITDFGATPNDENLDTKAIQNAIDACANSGRGTVIIPKGRFLSGSIYLKSGVTIYLQDKAVLHGSKKIADYYNPGGRRRPDPLINGVGLTGIGIDGPGTIDGADCRNAQGEEGFRGPHSIHFRDCQNVKIENITIVRAGNYAMRMDRSDKIVVEKVTVRGGHDGLHTQACKHVTVSGCDFRTGDDAFAGCDNEDFKISGTKINSSCNGFRLGCLRMIVEDCHIRGPGEYQHQISKRSNMLAAFVHFAPKDRHPKLPSDQWTLKNLTIDRADALYLYDFNKGLWQQGQPAKNIVFDNVQAKGLAKPIRAFGNEERQLKLKFKNCAFAMAPSKDKQPVMILQSFGSLELDNVTLANDASQPSVVARDGNLVTSRQLTTKPEREKPVRLESVQSSRLKD